MGEPIELSIGMPETSTHLSGSPLPADPRYIITPQGDVYGAFGRKLKQPVGKRGYPVVNINGIPRTIHSLVMETFVGPRPEGMQVRHLNGNPLDNRLENLQYGTAAENQHDKFAHGTMYQLKKTHCPSGHEYSAANTIHSTRGDGRRFRICRTCNRNSSQRRRSNP